LVTGLPIPLDEIKGLAKELKQKCGTGGTVKDAVIEIQGDHRDTIVELLQQKGFTAKRAGG
jgi:translation initiation factor 1